MPLTSDEKIAQNFNLLIKDFRKLTRISKAWRMEIGEEQEHLVLYFIMERDDTLMQIAGPYVLTESGTRSAIISLREMLGAYRDDMKSIKKMIRKLTK